MLRHVISLYRDAFGGLARETWVLVAVALVNRAGTMVLPFLTLYLTRELRFDKGEAGWVIFAFGIGSVIGTFAGGRLSDRVGAIPVQLFSLIAGGAGFLLLGLLRTVPALMAGFAVLGMLGDAFRPACMTAVAESASPETRTRALTLLRMAINLGITVGPLVGGMLALVDYFWLFVVDGSTCCMAAALLWVTVGRRYRRQGAAAATATPTPSGPSPRKRDWPFLGLLAVLFGLAVVFFQTMGTLPLYYREHFGLLENRIGMLFGLNALIIVIVEMVLVHRLQQCDHLRMMGWGCLLVCLGFGLMPWGSGWPYAVFTVLVWTAGEMLALPFANSLVAARAGTTDVGRYMGAYTALFAVALVIAPATGLWIYARVGGTALWSAAGMLGLVLWAGCAALAPRFRAHGRPAGPAGS